MLLKILSISTLFICITFPQSSKEFLFKDNFMELSFEYPDSFFTIGGGNGIIKLVWDEGGSNVFDTVYFPPTKAIYIDIILSYNNFEKVAAEEYFVFSGNTWFDYRNFVRGVTTPHSEDLNFDGWKGFKVYTEWDLTQVLKKEFIQKGYRYLISKNFVNKNIYISADQRNSPEILDILKEIGSTVAFSEHPLNYNKNKKYNSIREVDFYNFAYVGSNNDTLFVKDSLYFAETGSEDNPYYTYEILGVNYGDLTKDEKEEAAIFTFEHAAGTTGQFSGGFVYTLIDGKPKMIYEIEMGDRAAGGITYIAINDGLLWISRYDGLGGLCCPEYNITTGYLWDGYTFIEKTCHGQIDNYGYGDYEIKDILKFESLRKGVILTDSVEFDAFYLLELQKNRKVTMDVVSSSKKSGMFLVLTDSKGEVIEPCNGIRNNKIELIIPQNGFYTLRISNDSVWKQQYKTTIRVN